MLHFNHRLDLNKTFKYRTLDLVKECFVPHLNNKKSNCLAVESIYTSSKAHVYKNRGSIPIVIIQQPKWPEMKSHGSYTRIPHQFPPKIWNFYWWCYSTFLRVFNEKQRFKSILFITQDIRTRCSIFASISGYFHRFQINKRNFEHPQEDLAEKQAKPQR